MAISLYISGFVSDKLINRRMSIRLVRRLFCSLGFTLQTFFILAIVFSTGFYELVVFMTFAIGTGGLVWASFSVNLLDIGAKVSLIYFVYNFRLFLIHSF